jgi:hypothetical protein
MPNMKDWYAKNQSKNDPFYYIQDESVWIFPAVTESVLDGLEVEAILHPDDLLIGATSANVRLQKIWNRALREGMLQYAYEYLGKDNMIDISRQRYEVMRDQILMQFADKDQ